jgi:formate dehydrogenase assembly factor FdhD
VFAPTNAHAVARGLGYVREHGLWKVRGHESWEGYVDHSLGVASVLVNAVIDGAEQVPAELVEALERMPVQDEDRRRHMIRYRYCGVCGTRAIAHDEYHLGVLAEMGWNEGGRCPDCR